jgi:5-methylcytosine-specific restriction enzyme A
MPTRAMKQCSKPGCAELTTGGLCDKHRKERAKMSDESRGNSAARGYGAAWRKLREAHLNLEPYCRRCREKGLEVLATDVDRIKPLEVGGSDDDSNLQSLCHSCHSRKTATEDGGFGRPVRTRKEGG